MGLPLLKFGPFDRLLRSKQPLGLGPKANADVAELVDALVSGSH
jgi:hypothetical protein